MNKRFLKMLSVLLTAVMLIAMASVAFAADPALSGSGTKDNPYLLQNADDFSELVENTSTYDGKYIALAGNISFGNTLIDPIGTEDHPFKGFFDGKGFIISNYELDGEYNCYGLFGYVRDAVISNVTINNALVYCSPYKAIGAVVGYAENTEISNVKINSGNLTGASNVGGIVGEIKGGTISNCVNGSSVKLNNTTGVNSGPNAGGIAGKAENSRITCCINTGVIDGNKQKNAGGIVGWSNGTVSHCLNKGNVTSSMNTYSGSSTGIAGIAGSAGGTISYCGNAGSITSQTDCSGIFAIADGLSVSYCYNAGEISYNTNIDGTSDTIGFGATVDHCIGVGGDVTAEMLKSKDAYEGWDFDTVWIEPGEFHDYFYPMLWDCSFHKISKTSSTSATCTSEGKDEYTCELHCGFTYEITTAEALGHQKVLKNTVPANCTVEGEKTYKCKRCGNDLPDETEVLPIDPDAHVDADGDNVCDLCEKTIKQEETKRTFFQKIGDFFRRIFDWIKNLFKRK